MSAFTALLKQSREFTAVCDALRVGRAPLGVLGLANAQKAHWISAICETLRRPAVVLCPDENAASRLCDDLNAFTGGACVYPARDFHFRTEDSASHEYEQLRIGVLSNYLSGKAKVIVTTAQAACQLTLPRAALQKNTVVLREGADCRLEDVTATLLAAGYARVEQVDFIGQFSQRGGILDVFPPHAKKPLRIEFWGDTVDSIASFDPETQRREDRLEEITLTPATEVLFQSDDVLREKLAAFLSTIKGKGSVKAKATITRDLEQLQSGVRLSCVDRYLSLAYETPESLFDYAADALMFVSESAGVRQRMESAQKLLLEDLKLMTEEGHIVKGLDTFSLTLSQLLNRYTETGAVFLDNLARGSFDVPVRLLTTVEATTAAPWDGTLSYLLEDLQPLLRKKDATVIVAAGTEKSAKELAYDLETEGVSALYFSVVPAAFPQGRVSVIPGVFSSGFSYPALNISVFTHRRAGLSAAAQKAKRRFKAGKGIASLEEIARGDYVVHAVHGIGVFDGIKTMTIDGKVKDFIKISYRGSDVLYMPVTQLDLVSKYISPRDSDKPVKLNRLGSDEWKKTKTRVRASVQDLAVQLTALYAQRLHAKGFAFSPDIDMQNDFERRFIFDETDDQLEAINEIKRDMERPYPMDRLLCGDVGFGKTEVALRAAFKCVADGKQCAILVPTTILAFQHYQTIQKRFDGFPVEVEMLSRFRTQTERTKIKKALRRGAVDIVVGTHAIIAKNVEFKDLGLLIVDEEQRFGVAQKERLKERFPLVDVLTLSATPIPRTLNMAMSGIRDMSILEMPPADRHPVQTYVVPHDMGVLCEAMDREIRRGGQVYYLHNRVETIDRTAAKIKQLLPDARIGIGHGRMSEDELSEVWRKLLEGEIDILVCTTIIETGVDVPNANTLIIENADRLGLAQLHQIRGRVGRSTRRAFAYFTYMPQKQLSSEAQRRLSAIREYTEFGSDFHIAMRDLEIRGAGNVLGAQQHGHMEAVGYDLYLRLLSQAVANEKDQNDDAPEEDGCLIDVAIDAHIPETYVDSVKNRIYLYKRIAAVRTQEDVLDVIDECIDRFGEPPESVRGLCEVALIRARATALGVTEISQRGTSLLLFLDEIRPAWISMLATLMKGRIMVSGGKRPYLSVRMLDESATEILPRVLKIMEAAKAEDKKE
ncbi:MAG: transcription-repair coupling factor [Clostridia bacterium]|nr:transcription-repair coupling factor [Clostridia bacterium]